MKLVSHTVRTNYPPAARQARRGVSIILVLSSMVFLSMAIMSMGTLFAHEVRRTRAAVAETQLRQLLLAAAHEAQAQLRANPAPRDVAMVVPVEDASVMLHIANSAVTVEARLHTFKATQSLHMDKGQITAATLTQTAGQ